ncbi:helix-turn-helix domain-containing protein [Myceligenerans halotolerans]
MATSAKARREQLRERLLAQGHAMAHVAAEIGTTFRVRPRTAWRYAMGWPQWKLVQQLRTTNPDLTISESRVSEWESWPYGGTKPSLTILGALARTFGNGCTVSDLLDDADQELFSLAELMVVDHTADRSEHVIMVPSTGSTVTGPVREGDDDVHRREMLRLLSTFAATMLLPVAPAPGPTPPVAEFRKFNEHLWQVYAFAPSKSDAMPLVRRQLSVLVECLRGSPGPSARRHLCTLAADLFQLAGEIYFDADHYTDAAHCYHLAAQAGKEAGSHDLWACALTRHAYLSVYEKRFADAAPLLDLAATIATRGDGELSTRHWVAAVQGETFAGLGDLDACRRALDSAEEVAGLTGTIHNGGWLRFNGSRLPEERGTCYVTLGRPDLAEAALTEALGHATSIRRRAGVLADLAVVGAQRGDLDQVITHADAVLTHAHETRSGMIARKLLDLRPHLGPLQGDLRVRELDARITTLTAA